MPVLFLIVCVLFQIFTFTNKYITARKYRELKKSGNFVMLPESFFWVGVVGTIYMMQFFCPWGINLFATPPPFWYNLFLFATFCFVGSLQLAQANWKIFYDEEHIYYFTWLGHKYIFNYTDIIGKKSDFDLVYVTNQKRNIRVETAGVGRKKFTRFVQLKQKELKKRNNDLAKEKESK